MSGVISTGASISTSFIYLHRRMGRISLSALIVRGETGESLFRYDRDHSLFQSVC